MTSLFPQDKVSFPASLLSIFTALPLSCKERDRLRLCFLSSLATVMMTVWSLFVGYHEIDEMGGNISTTTNTTEVGGGAADTRDGTGIELFSDTRVWPATIVVVALMVVKVVVYVFKIDKMEPGKGKIENTGLSLFALSDSSHQQFKSFNAGSWEKYFQTESQPNLQKGVGRENSPEHRELQKAVKRNANMLVTMVQGLVRCQKAVALESASSLIKQGKQSKLTHLCLRDCNAKEDWHKTGVFGTMTNWLQTEVILRELNLRGCNITNDSFLSGNSMVDDIAEVLESNTHLKMLDLSYNNAIGDEGFKRIMKAFGSKKSNTTLDNLRMKNCNLTKDSGKVLLEYLEWKLVERSDEINKEAEDNKVLDYWKNKALQSWGLRQIDLRHQISVTPHRRQGQSNILDMRSALNVAAGRFEVDLPTKKMDIVVVLL